MAVVVEPYTKEKIISAIRIWNEVVREGVGHVGNTGNGVFLRNIFSDFIETKSLVSQYFLPSRVTLLNNFMASLQS